MPTASEATYTLFIVRIELHDIGEDHNAYSILHEKMHIAGFNQEAMVNGIKHVMPRATYRRWDLATKSTAVVNALAKAALNATIAECKKSNPPSHLNGSTYTIKSAEAPVTSGLSPV
jgi:hypothetical protein